MILVGTDREGFEARKLQAKLGIRASDTAEIFFTDLRAPGKPHRQGPPGEGLKRVMSRVLSLKEIRLQHDEPIVLARDQSFPWIGLF